MLMAKARHMQPENVRRYFRPFPGVLMDAICRKFADDVGSVPSFNDAFGKCRVPRTRQATACPSVSTCVTP